MKNTEGFFIAILSAFPIAMIGGLCVWISWRIDKQQEQIELFHKKVKIIDSLIGHNEFSEIDLSINHALSDLSKSKVRFEKISDSILTIHKNLKLMVKTARFIEVYKDRRSFHEDEIRTLRKWLYEGIPNSHIQGYHARPGIADSTIKTLKERVPSVWDDFKVHQILQPTNRYPPNALMDSIQKEIERLEKHKPK